MINDWMFKPLFYIAWITVIVVFAFFTRWWVDEKHRGINHAGQFVIRLVLAFANTFIYYGFAPEQMLAGLEQPPTNNVWKVFSQVLEQMWAMKEWFLLLAWQGVIFWDLFDPFLNYLRGKPVKYVSKSNYFDKFFHRYKDPWKAQTIAKGILTAILLAALLIV